MQRTRATPAPGEFLFDRKRGLHEEHLQVVPVCHFGFGLSTHADHGYAACEFRKTFLEFFLVVIAIGLLNLSADRATLLSISARFPAPRQW